MKFAEFLSKASAAKAIFKKKPSEESPKPKKKKTALIILIVAGVLVLVGGVVIWLLRVRARHRKEMEEETVYWSTDPDANEYDPEENLSEEPVEEA